MPKGKEISYLSFGEIFDGRFFEIPDYQRGYSWEKREVADLIDDIQRLMSGSMEMEHFTGTIIAIEKGDSIFEIIDGQQRLTSLVILVQAICDTNKEKYKDKMEKYVQIPSSDKKKLKLKPNYEDTKIFFEKCIVENDIQQESKDFAPHKNMMTAKNKFSDWLKDIDIDIDSILEVIEEKLKFIFFIPKDTKTISLMFEAINNRGKPLSELEKIKNYLIYLTALKDLSDMREHVNYGWKIVLDNLSDANVQNIDGENYFLRYCYIVYFTNHNLPFRMLLENFESNDINDFLSFLQDASENYKYFLDQDLRNKATHIDKQVKKYIKYLRCHDSNASIMPLYLSIMNKKNNDKLNLLKILEKLNFRYYILGVAKRSDARKKELYNLAHKYFSDKNFDDEKLKEYLINFIKNRSPLELIQKKLQPSEESNSDFYNWKSLKYFLARYEELLSIKDAKKTYNVEEILKTRKEAGEHTGDYISTEHIWASNNMPEFKDHYEKRRLGNFALMGLYKNIRSSDSSIEDKIQEMKKSSGKNFSQVNALEKYLESVQKEHELSKRSRNYSIHLSKAINDLREKDLVEFAIETWALDEEELKEYKESEEYKNYLAYSE